MGEDWRRLADYVVSARKAAGYHDLGAFEVATGVTRRTLSKLQNGHEVSPDTLAAVEVAVRWKPGSCQAILAGGEAELMPPLDDETAELLRLIDALPPHLKRAAIGLLKALDQRTGGEDAREQG